jgi:sulfhydrogenase subunit beta (sulfur reductase)
VSEGTPNGRRVLDQAGLEALIAALSHRGYRVIGPTLGEGAIVYDEVRSLTDLPRGWTDEQDGGTYRLRRRDDEALFGYAVGPQSWKRFLFPPRTLLFRARRSGDRGFTVSDPGEEAPPLAFLGGRGCDLHAIAVQGRVFCQDGREDPTYAARRERAFI